MRCHTTRSILALVLLLSAFVLPVHAHVQRDALPVPVPVVEPAALPAEAAEAGITAPQWSSITRQITDYESAARGDASALDLEEQVKLTAPDGNPEDRFGNAVAMACDLLLVGALGDDTQTGAAYLFQRNKGGADTWGLVKKLVANDGSASEWFGNDVGLSCDIAVVGAPGAGPNSQGAAYVYYRNYDPANPATSNPDNWGLRKKLTLGAAAVADDSFGTAVDVDCDTIAVGAPGRDWPLYAEEGAVYLFARNYDPANPAVASADNWGLLVALNSGAYAQSGQGFGWSLDLDCRILVVGAPYYDLPGALNGGVAFVFGALPGGDVPWQRIATLYGSTTAANANFGHAVAVSCDTILVGAPGQEGADGRVYVFGRNFDPGDPEVAYPNLWGEVTWMAPPEAGANGGFGRSVALDRGRAVVGEPGGGASEEGRAYVFERNVAGPDSWGLRIKLVASDGLDYDGFGQSVAIWGDTIVVGCPFDDVITDYNHGSAYVFQRNQDGADAWGQVKRITASSPQNSAIFGMAVAIWGDTILAGSPDYDGPTGYGQGAVYVFRRDLGGVNNWGQVKLLLAGDGAETDYFGLELALWCDTAVVAAPQKASNQGAAYVYARNQGGADNWGQVKKLSASDGSAYDGFGYDVAIHGDTVVVGAPFRYFGSGGAYVFQRNYDPANPGTPAAENWGQRKQLSGAGNQAEYFGSSVGIWGDTVVVGAQAYFTPGSAGLFERNLGGSDNWGLAATLTPSDGVDGDRFGGAASIWGDVVAIGSPAKSSSTGAAYLFGCFVPTLASDVQVTKTASPALVYPGDAITYTLTYTNSGPGPASKVWITYTNSGPGPASEVWITDTLPPGVTYLGSIVDPGWIGPNISGQTVSWYNATLPAGASGQFAFAGEVSLLAPVSADWVLTNSAVIGAAEDATPDNNSATADTVLQGLQIRKSHYPATVTAAWDFWMYVDVANRASSAATNVVVTDTLPAGVAALLGAAGYGRCVRRGQHGGVDHPHHRPQRHRPADDQGTNLLDPGRQLPGQPGRGRQRSGRPARFGAGHLLRGQGRAGPTHADAHARTYSHTSRYHGGHHKGRAGRLARYLHLSLPALCQLLAPAPAQGGLQADQRDPHPVRPLAHPGRGQGGGGLAGGL